MLVAEFGDKTQLVALSLMTKTKRPFQVASGATIGILITTIIGIAVALLLAELIPTDIISVVSGIIFLVLGLLALREARGKEETEEGSDDDVPIKNPFFSAVGLVALAELGDKSQLFVVAQTLAGDSIGVFFGAVLGMATILFATAIVGETLMKKLPDSYLDYGAAGLFILAGLLILFF